MYEIVMDTGGTFTDAVLIDDDRRISIAKSPTDPLQPSIGILGCLQELAAARSVALDAMLGDVSSLVIGTTLPTNTIVEGKGAKCCLIYTDGFRDIPELGRRIPKDDIYNLKVHAPQALIPRHLRYGVRERIRYDGVVLTPLVAADVATAVQRAKADGVEVPVVCFLHSYINPEHEREAGRLIQEAYPNVVLSSQILRRWMEWERLSTAMMAAYVKPVVTRFLGHLDDELRSTGFAGTLLFTTCLGGVASPQLCLENPALQIGSGPASGPLLGRFLGETVGFEHVLVLDMGGTTCDIGLLPHRAITTSPEMRVGDFINALESVDVASIGAGGGSIARIDDRGILHVGPTSAGANPGPACYGKGGSEPTVTDADVVLGTIPADFFLGGRMPLDVDAARTVIEEKVAVPLGLDILDAAHAVAALVEENMAQGIFMNAVERGLDPRDFTLVVGGGAGAVHAAAVAARLDIKDVYVPRHAAVFCALGAALANYDYVLNHCIYRRQDTLEADELAQWYGALEEEGAATLEAQGLDAAAMRFARGAEMRYFGQLRDIVVFLPEELRGVPFTDETFARLIAQFHARHQAMYGWADPAMSVTISTLKLKATGLRRPLELVGAEAQASPSEPQVKRIRPVYFAGLGLVDTPCYDDTVLANGDEVEGPAIVEAESTTLVVPPGSRLVVDRWDNYLIRRPQ